MNSNRNHSVEGAAADAARSRPSARWRRPRPLLRPPRATRVSSEEDRKLRPEANEPSFPNVPVSAAVRGPIGAGGYGTRATSRTSKQARPLREPETVRFQRGVPMGIRGISSFSNEWHPSAVSAWPF